MGGSLTEDERLAALLGDAIDGLEAFQATEPFQGIEDLTNTIRFVRDRLVRRQAVDVSAVLHALHAGQAASLPRDKGEEL